MMRGTVGNPLNERHPKEESSPSLLSDRSVDESASPSAPKKGTVVERETELSDSEISATGTNESGIVTFSSNEQTTETRKGQEEGKSARPFMSSPQHGGGCEVGRSKQDCNSPSESGNEKTWGSGSDGGYAGSASSNSQFGTEQSSLSSSEGAGTSTKTSSKSQPHHSRKSRAHSEHHNHRPREQRQKWFPSSSSSSSELADFSSASAANAGGHSFVFSRSMYSSSSNGDDSADEWDQTNKTKRERTSSGLSDNKRASKPGCSKKRNRLQTEQTGPDSSSLVLQHSPTRDSSGPTKSITDKESDQSTFQLSQPLHRGALHGGMSILEKSFQRKMGRYAKKKHGHHQHRRRHAQDLLVMGFSSKKRSDESDDLTASSSLKTSSSTSIFSVDEVTPIYSVGDDIMAQCLCFLEPVEVYSVLSMPLSKMWRSTFTIPQDLWKILCHLKPFHAKVDEETSTDEPMNPFPICSALEVRHMFGRYRLLYTSFVRCVRYLARIKDDAIKGNAPSTIDDVGGALGHSGALAFPRYHDFSCNSNLKDFFARAGKVVRKNRRKHSKIIKGDDSSTRSSSDEGGSRPNSPLGGDGDEDKLEGGSLSDALASKPAENITKTTRRKRKRESKLKFSHSSLTEKLLGPSKVSGDVGNVELPWSCAIYSIVNWMVAFSDVEGIQAMCLRVLPFLLEDENQRTIAQRAGLTDIVLRAMVIFPDSAELHTAAFHTLVLLARPLGGREGMLFHTAMVNSSGIFNIGSNAGRNGIAVMLDSMRRFSRDEVLQAMSCWSMVNIALLSSQKTMLVKLGGISVAANAMMQHPLNAEVQFRALFALINLVIPSDSSSSESTSGEHQVLGDVADVTEKEMLDENVGQIANLVVVSMKNFFSNEAILNRACLVLHNLSLSESYHTTLLWTPNCYQMLEWCIGNFRHDTVLQQSAGGTLQRLQMTLANDSNLRKRFTESLLSQRRNSVDWA